MNLRKAGKRLVAAALSLLVALPVSLPGLGGMAAAADSTTPVMHFGAIEGTYTAPNGGQQNLYADWKLADGTTLNTGVDLSGYNYSQLELWMTVELSSSNPDYPVNFDGRIKLRSVDTDGQENNIGFFVGQLGLKLGTNTVRLNMAQFVQNGWFDYKGEADFSKVNRMIFYIDSIPKDQGITYTMTLRDVYVMNVVNSDTSLAPRVATPSAGMESMDKIFYLADATGFGADPTGAADSTNAIQTAINRVNDQQGGTVFLPAGRYKVLGTLDLPAGVTLRGEWINPDKGGLGKGTILMAYSGRGTEAPTDGPFIRQHSSSCLRDISVWYPEQDPANPVAYPATVHADGHSDTINVTFYNSYTGFYNNSCSSMLIRQMYGSPLKLGIHGAFAYDIPRIENVHFDTAYWANSGLPGAPAGDALNALNTYTENNLVALSAGEQDWGYWYDLSFNHAKWGIFLTAVLDDPGQKYVPGNIAAGKVVTRNTKVGVYMENVGYPGFELTYSDIEATEYGMYYAAFPAVYNTYREQGLRVDWSDNATIVVSASSFKGGKAAFWSDKSGNYNINFNDCTFDGYSQCAVRLPDGSLTSANSQYKVNRTPFIFTADVDQAVLVGNTFTTSTLVSGSGWSNADSRITRDDNDRSVPHTPDYDYTYVSDVKPATDAVFNVADYGATVGTTRRIPGRDSTAAIQQALDAAEAAGGGTVYIPAGVYRVDGALHVATGVELRGSFESAHYGNSTNRGTQLYAYGYKDDANGPALITLEEGAGVKGFTVFYPDQRYTDQTDNSDMRLHAYPPTVRANKNTWIQNMTMIGTYTAIDAMSDNCDNIVITDVTGAAMYASLILGHGTNGGVVQNLHFNYSGWTQQGSYANQPKGNNGTNAALEEYTTRVTKGIILGDAKNVEFFSCFNIIVAEQILLQQDPYTGGSFKGTMWGVAFDAATNGVVGDAGCDADLTIISSMGVFNRQEGGYNVYTKPGFTGHIALFNADAWDARSNLVNVAGGTVDLVQYFSWCVHNGVVKKGGTLNLYASTMVSNNGDNSGTTPDYTYESGSYGEVVGNLDCVKKLNVISQTGSYVRKRLNGQELATGSSETLTFSGLGSRTYTADNRDGGKNILETGWVRADGLSGDNRGVNLTASSRDNLHLRMTVHLEAQDNADGDEVFSTGKLMLRATDQNGERTCFWSVNSLRLHAGDNEIDVSLANAQDWDKFSLAAVNRVRLYIDSLNRYQGRFTMTVTDARLEDVAHNSDGVAARRAKLKEMLDAKRVGDELAVYTADSIAAYNQRYAAAQTVYADAAATSDAILGQILSLNEAGRVLERRPSTADAGLLAQLWQAILDMRSPADLAGYTNASIREYRAKYTTARGVYNDPDSTDDDIRAQLAILANAEEVLVEYQVEIIPIATNELNSRVAHYMNVFQQYDPPLDLTQYGERTGADVQFEIRVNKDEATFPDTVPYGPDEWVGWITNGALMVWSGGLTNDFRYKLTDLKCRVQDDPLQDASVGEFVTVTVTLPQAILANGRIDKWEIYIYNDLHRLMQNRDPDHRDQYTEQNEGSRGVTITVRNFALALGDLVEADKTALQTAVEEAERLDLSVYTPATAQALSEALAAGQALLDGVVTDQQVVNDATAALRSAIDGLRRKADKAGLNALIAQAEAIDTANATPITAAALSSALEKARAAAADDEATAAQVDLARQELADAMQALTPKADKTALNDLIAEKEATKTAGFTDESVNALKEAIQAAKKIAGNPNASQEDVDAAIAALNAAQLERDVTLGDLDGDESVSAADALMALQIATGKIEPTAQQKRAGDVNFSGNVMANDALLILQYATGKISAF
ncbi:MAG: glycosyl hydrolase family 28-related protein [Acutalibacteraceae bacterium]|jgi:hypothetical protein